MVSAYSFLKKGGFNKADKNWFDNELGSYADFDDFVHNWLNKENIWKWHYFRPQYSYMLEAKEKVALDFVGFFEHLNEDFSYVAKRIGTEVALPQSNKREHRSFQDYYTAASREIVRDVYREDIVMLGYNFDNSSLADQLASRDAGNTFSLRSVNQ